MAKRKLTINSTLKTQKAQTILEYTVVIGLVVAILITMGPYFQRLIQGSIKLTADQIGFQENADQDFSVGYLQASHTIADTILNGTIEEDGAGTTTYFYDDTIATTSNAQVDLGFVETPDP